MTNSAQNKPKYLINCEEGANHVERASISFVLAATASKDHEAVVFITSDATHLCVKGGASGLVSNGMEPLEDLMNQFIGNGGKIWICPICAKVKGVKEDDLITGAEIAGAPRTMAFLASGGQMLA
jgi:predicted peroxiredoxin